MAILEETKNRAITYLGIALLVAGYLISLYNIHRTNEAQYDPDTKTIRMVHWHLETGVREKLQKQIHRFEQMKLEEGEKVRVIQLPVADRGYLQFVRTNMIGGTLPDLVEWGRLHNPADIARYFRPITEELSVPNPYNVGTDLEQTPWRETFFDDLRYSYVRELHDYYSVGFSTFTIRLFYNKDILREATGTDSVPQEYEAFLDTCVRIQDYADLEGVALHPISSSSHAVTIFESVLQPTLIGNLSYDLDYSIDGHLNLQEKLYGYLSGVYRFEDDAEMRYAHEIVSRLTDHFAPGFMATRRDESVRQFLQGRAVFYASGSWDVPSLMFNTPFELGVTDFPIPDGSHPKYGAYFDGRPTEAETRTGFSFGISSGSPHQDLAIEFLQFMTSREINEDLNAEMKWIPALKNAKVDPFLEPFLPNPRGSVNPWLFSLLGASGRVYMLREQLYWPYLSGESGYDEYARAMEERYIEAAAHDLQIQDENNRRGAYHADLTRWTLALRAFSAQDPEIQTEDEWRWRVSTEALYHSIKDTHVNRQVYNDLFQEKQNRPAQRLRQALNLEEGEQYAP